MWSGRYERGRDLGKFIAIEVLESFLIIEYGIAVQALLLFSRRED
jgi:hypothetical protein